MINKENILQTAQSLVRQYDLPLKLLGVEEGTEAVAIYFTSEKRIKLRELAQELEFQLNLPIKLERVKKSETGKIGGVDVLGNQLCCASFLRKCPFGEKYGCGYGFTSSKFKVQSSKYEEKKAPAEAKPAKPVETPRRSKKRKKKIVRRVVLKR